MPKQSAVMKIAWQIARKIIAEQTFARLAIGHDAAIIAAHRVFGMGPKRAKTFDAEVKAAMIDLYGKYADIWNNDTKDVEYGKATMDAALKQIYGDLFVPWDERYSR